MLYSEVRSNFVCTALRASTCIGFRTPQQVLARSRKDLGYTEGPNNSNRFAASWGLPGQAWCADAVCRWLADADALDNLRGS